MVVADKTGNPDFIASDLLSQAEHGSDSQVILVTNNIKIADTTFKKISEQLENLQRKVTAQKALNNSKVICFDNDKDMIEFVNLYGAEHLIVCLENETEFIDLIKHAGSVFMGITLQRVLETMPQALITLYPQMVM